MALPSGTPLVTNLPLCSKAVQLATHTLMQLDRTDFSSYYQGKKSEGFNEAGLKAVLCAILRILEAADDDLEIEVLESEYAVEADSSSSFVDLRIKRPGYPMLLLELKYLGPGYLSAPRFQENDAFNALYAQYDTKSSFRVNPQLDAFRDLCANRRLDATDPVGIPDAVGSLTVFVAIPGAKRKNLSDAQQNMSVAQFARWASANQLDDYLGLQRQRTPAATLEGAVILGIADRIFIHDFKRLGTDGANNDDDEDDEDTESLTEDMTALAITDARDEGTA